MKIKNILIAFIILFSFCTSLSFAQVQKLNKLSSGTFIDSQIIFDSEKSDVYGYFILYEKDVKNKNTTELEYVLLDNNLNKISSDTFFENNYENAFHKPKAILSKVKKIKNDLLIEIATQEKNRTNKFHHRYRKLNLNDFSLSDAFVIQNKTVKDEIYAEDKIIQISEIISNQNLETTKGSYFIVYDLPQDNQNTEIGLLTKNKVKSIKGFTVLDSEFNSLWHKPFSDYYETLLSSDSTTFVMKNFDYEDVFEDVKIYDAKKGLVKTLSLLDKNTYQVIKNIDFTASQIIFNTQQFEVKKNKLKNMIGIGKVIVDKKTGEIVSSYLLPWNQFGPHFNNVNINGEIKKNNSIGDYGNIIIQDYQNLPNGNTIVIAEGYKIAYKSKILDLFVIELDSEYQINHFYKIEKNPTTFNIDPYMPIAIQIANNGLFDYLYSQNLDNQGNKVFYYINNEKEGSRTSQRKNPKWVLGIITYVDGNINIDKLELTKKDSKIIPGIAKNGYIRLMEFDEEGNVELRLEKINY